MAEGKRSTGPGGLSAESVLVFIGIGLFAIVVGGTWVATKIASMISHTHPISDPMSNQVDMINGRVRWSGAATGVLIIELVVLGLLTAGGFFLVVKACSRGSRVDGSAQLMSKRKEI